MSNISSFIDAIFMGLGLFIPLLVLLKFTSLFHKKIDIKTRIIATNLLLPIAATINLIFFVSEIFAAYYSQTTMNRLG
ncbi:hypothetical protein DIU36_28255 [Mucilaginibacter rubeus]|nr:hypothetical protein DIU36_28255 [Mucilaginibacter rubeus]